MSRVVRRTCLIILLSSLRSFAFAQNSYHIDQSIPVQVNGKTISLPWAGGLNSAQINTIDLNNDGREDLAIFDRMANKFLTFINSGTRYIYDPDYETYFPSTLTEWALLRDFNCDGKKDLFTSDPAGISVFVNITPHGGKLRWRLFNPGNPLLTIGFNGPINLKVNATDIPAIDDVDEDGDLDIIVARFVGVGSVEYHKNLSIEKLGRCDSMQFTRITNTWGNFEECNCGRYAFGGIDCSQVPGGRVLHDAGKSLLTLDIDNNGIRDLLFSEENCTSLYLLVNHGTPDDPEITSFSTYPASNPSTLLFPAAFYEDIDFDGVKDLLVSTNISARVTTDIDLSNSMWLYKNGGTTVAPQFSLKQTNWLQDQMIDAGSYASPAFADYDNDGDLDLFIGFWAEPGIVASIYLYKNTGTFLSPSFEFVTDDYLQFKNFGLFNVKIQFVDLDKNGTTDLVFSASEANQLTTQLYVLRNQSSKAFDFSGQSPEPLNFTVDSYENLMIHDVDHDGLPDILIGKSDGSLQYWNNSGPASSPHFGLFNSSYLGISSSITRFCVNPSIADVNNDGKEDLLLGNQGTIVLYNDFHSGNVVPDTLYISNSLKNVAEAKFLSSNISIATADLYGNKDPMVAAGLITGGILMLKADSLHVNTRENIVKVWPNPLTIGQDINVRVSQDSEIQFFSVLGQQLTDPLPVVGGELTVIPQALTSGLYIARVKWSGGIQAVKLVVR